MSLSNRFLPLGKRGIVIIMSVVCLHLNNSDFSESLRDRKLKFDTKDVNDDVFDICQACLRMHVLFIKPK